MTWTKIAVGTALLTASALIVGIGMAGSQEPKEKPTDPKPAAEVSKPLDRDAVRAIDASLHSAKPYDSETVPLKQFPTPATFESEAAALRYIQFEAVCREFELRVQEFSVGRGSLDMLLDCARRRLRSQLSVTTSKEDRLSFSTEFQQLMDQLYASNWIDSNKVR